MNTELDNCILIMQGYGANEIYLFGSRSSEQHRKDSEYDFAVTGVDSSDYFRMLGDLLVECSVDVDVVMLDDSNFSNHIKQKISKGFAKRVA
jgi:predicted nucleotidyltransferase